MLRPGKIIVDPRQQDNRKLSTATDARMFYHGNLSHFSDFVNPLPQKNERSPLIRGYEAIAPLSKNWV
ncbi:hypothetical protein [Arthrospira platensis]|uniref:hypothetical protein n=1 Tax=Limnospira platensis TaxID=118562 RepID=UPI000F80569A|nr:hypothetical protein [Arthrospira platensis]MBD2571751.1 hypothetical protein [Arthrospira platensis FACHB-971]MBD2708774.1 hypothetical protein [Arthrospira platensis FACHB-835]MDF2212433.1 hypothetical protein [Arthrospira platensis NCB002]QQW27533.1 hypothetical protein AP9108_20215 [Arthrospira sp. PCC 9108]